MTSLQISPGQLISGVLLIISFVTFVFAYNKAIKDSVNKRDLDDLKQYVDQQDRHIQNHVDEAKATIEHVKDEINRKLDLILAKLIK